MQYIFKVDKEITTCTDCPIMNSDCEWGFSCNLEVEIDPDGMDISIPEECPLIQIVITEEQIL